MQTALAAVGGKPGDVRGVIGAAEYARLKAGKQSGESGCFAPMPAPGPDSWLWSRAGRGQTFDSWARGKRRTVCDRRKVIYVRVVDPTHAQLDGVMAPLL